MGMTDHARPRAIERHIATQYARDSVAKALYEAILDGVEHGPLDLRTSGDREWLRGAIAMPIQEATDVALHVLAWRLAQALERAPEGLMRRFDSSYESREVGWD